MGTQNSVVADHIITARIAKARRLLATIDAAALEAGYSLTHDALTLAAAVREWDAERWLRAARHAGVNPPSATTQDLVIHWIANRYMCAGCGSRNGSHSASCSGFGRAA